MSFSIKQLLTFTTFTAISLVSLSNANKSIASEFVDLIALATLVFMAYGVWLQKGEVRAFKTGFVIWSVVYFRLYKQTFNIGLDRVLEFVAAKSWEIRSVPSSERSEFASQPLSARDIWEYNTHSMGHSMLLLLFGLIGGWVTVYAYRQWRRQQDKSEQEFQADRSP